MLRFHLRGLLLVMTVTASILAGGQNSSKSTANVVNKPTIVRDTQGNVMPLGTKCLAERRLPNGELKIYRKTGEDISALVFDLKAEGVNDARLLNEKFWADNDCERKAGTECGSGSCSEKTCQATTQGGSTYCRCR
jgi:hypothetical protein